MSIEEALKEYHEHEHRLNRARRDFHNFEQRAESGRSNLLSLIAKAVIESGSLAGEWVLVDSDCFDSYELGLYEVPEDIELLFKNDYIMLSKIILELADNVKVKLYLSDRFKHRPRLRLAMAYPTKLPDFLTEIEKIGITISTETVVKIIKELNAMSVRLQNVVDEWTLKAVKNI